MTIEIDFADIEDDPTLLTVLADCLVKPASPAVARLMYRFQPKASLVKPHPAEKRERAFLARFSENALLLLDVDAVERVPAEGRELEVENLLAHRFQLHGVSDRRGG